MESTGGSSGSTTTAAAMPSPSVAADNCKVFCSSLFKASNFEFDPSISEEEKRFYLKAYPTVDVVRERKTHCTVCKIHIGTAPVQENGIKMHPILRVTHCNKCHDFYNSGEFSKGEDGSELYCRWCGQGGEVYCCSSCPYVFCKSCIVKNLSRGVVADIEQNENWNCFSCAPKILWPLRAQHWALMNYIEQQKTELYALNLSESELKVNLGKDRSKCCRLAKAKCGNMSDSMESLDSVASKRSHSSSFSAKKPSKHSGTPSPQHGNAAKRAKNNDEVVCTPDLLSMLEPDCQITVPTKPNRPMGTPSASTPKIMSIQQPQSGGYGSLHSTPKSSAPPPLVLRNTAIKLRPVAPPPVVRRTIIGPRTPNPGGNGTPVYHTINGYRIDLNSAAQQETFRLPNGKLIQVKRQGPTTPQAANASINNWQQMSSPQQQRVIPQTIASRPVQITPHPYNITVQQQQGQHPQVVRYHNNIIGTTTTINPVPHNGTTIQVVNGQISSGGPQVQQQQSVQQTGPIRPVMVRHVFPDNPVGHARTGLQDQVFNAMEICTHLTNKVQTLTNSNAYKQARNFLEVKELYIHLSYLLTYAIGRFKSLQDKCLGDMRTLGFGNDADCLENGQLAAAVDYVCYGQLDDVDLFNTGSNSFHNQVYEYRKSLHANLKDGEDGTKSPLPPIFSLSQSKSDDVDDEADGEDSLLEEPKGLKGHWMEGGDDSPIPNSYNQENEENEEPDDSFFDNDDDGMGYNRMQGTEESMKKNEETYVFDRKLTRLVSQYPSIWCTRHPDYGNFEVTRKQWRTISSHFENNDHIKLRWKNIRKRFVRIEKRIAEGKRFNGHFDKAMAFLANRDLPEDQWVTVDCGEDDGDTFSRNNLDAIEQSLHLQGKDELVDRNIVHHKKEDTHSSLRSQAAIRPIELEPLDLKIITFAKSNPVLWRKSMDPEADKIDEETRRTVWRQLQRSVPNKQASDDEDNEIEIVEPKTDLINLDSDDDEPSASTGGKTQQPFAHIKSQLVYNPNIKIKQGTSPIPVNTTIRPALAKPMAPITPTAPAAALSTSLMDDNMDLMSMAQSFLASMLEVEIQEGPPIYSPGSDSSGQKKQPRKKLTNKPNPTLLKQKALMERERLEEMKRNDQKLKMKCSVELKKAEEEFPYAKELLEAKLQMEEKEDDKDDLTTSTELNEEEDKEDNPKAVAENEEAINSSTEQKAESTENDSSKNAIEEKEPSDISIKIVEQTNETGNETETENETAEKMDKEIEETETSNESEKSEEIIPKATDQTAKDIEPLEEAKSNDGKDKEEPEKLENVDNLSAEECQETAESKINSSKEEDIEENKLNGLKNNENATDKMETDKDDDIPLATVANDESMEIDEQESPQTADITAEHEPKANESNSKSNELESKIEAEPEEKVENNALSQPQEDKSEIISDKEIKSVEEQPPLNTEEKNGNESLEPETENNLPPATLDNEQPTTPEKEIHKEASAVDLPVSEEKTNNKELPAAMEGVETIDATPPTDCKETNVSTTSNGNA